MLHLQDRLLLKAACFLKTKTIHFLLQRVKHVPYLAVLNLSIIKAEPDLAVLLIQAMYMILTMPLQNLLL